MQARFRNIVLMSLLSLLLITQIGASCMSSSEDDRPRNSDSDIEPITLPRNAKRVTDGRGVLTHTAARDGRVYLYDVDDRTLIDNRPMRRGQEYRVDPDQDKATLDGKKVYDNDLKRDHNHRLYFLADNSRDDREDDRDDRISGLPRDARSVEHGAGKISYRADRDGMVYIVDREDKKIIVKRGVRRDQQIVITPDKDRIEMDGVKIYNGNLVKDHEHEIYLDRN